MAYAHLREGACRELEFLLKQRAQHLVLSFEVKHSLLQLDALLPKVLPPPGRRWRKRRRAYQGGWMSTQFPSSEQWALLPGMPFSCNLLREGGCSYQILRGW